MGHPQRDTAGAFNLHQHHPLRKERCAIHLRLEGKILLTTENGVVEGNTKVRLILRIVRFSFIGEEYYGAQCFIIGKKIVNFLGNLCIRLQRPSPDIHSIAATSDSETRRLYTTS